MIEGIIFLLELIVLYIFLVKVNKNKYSKNSEDLGIFSFKKNLDQ
jgi:hypothetical protein